METTCTYLPYKSTGAFSAIVNDYLEEDEKLQPFYACPSTLNGVLKGIEQRKNTQNNRALLVDQLRKQYANLTLTSLQENYLQQLLLTNSFTICTAHQPNIFTGHLYFIYKIIHAIKLADTLRSHLPGNNFIPVFYMGSEDADLDELGHINIEGKGYKWDTQQSGAVGRMIVDKAFIHLIDEMQGQLSIHPFGKDLIELFRRCYLVGTTVQNATLTLVHELFKSFGLLVLIPDNAELKRPFNEIVKKEILEQFSFPLVQHTIEKLSEHYKVQAGGRAINLFYLLENSRERIEKTGDKYTLADKRKQWTEDVLLAEVEEYPERFSANVILRGVFQEMILPNIAFIGGGGEIAYWLELKKVFEASAVPFPVLVLRNSFMLANHQQFQLANKLGFKLEDLFATVDELMNTIVKKHNEVALSLNKQKEALQEIYLQVKQAGNAIDPTLSNHVSALEKRNLYQLKELEKKMLRAEKRKYEAELRQLIKLKSQLFPNNNLQERVDNFAIYYSKFGPGWLTSLYKHSLSLEQQFAIVETA